MPQICSQAKAGHELLLMAGPLTEVWASNPLQYSCLENPRDRGAWWAAVYGVAQSWTQLTRLSNSSSRVKKTGGEK